MGETRGQQQDQHKEAESGVGKKHKEQIAKLQISESAKDLRDTTKRQRSLREMVFKGKAQSSDDAIVTRSKMRGSTDTGGRKLKLYIRVGRYGRNPVLNALRIAIKGSKYWVAEPRTELDDTDTIVLDGVDEHVYVHSLLKLVTQRVGHEGILRRADNGDRLDVEKSLRRNNINNAATLRFDIGKHHHESSSTATVTEKKSEE